MKTTLFLLLAMMLMASCASTKAIGYQNHPLKPAYFPKRYWVHIGPVTFLDVQPMGKMKSF